MTLESDRLPDAVVQAILDVVDRCEAHSLLTPIIEEMLEEGADPRRVLCDFLYAEMMGDGKVYTNLVDERRQTDDAKL